MNLAEQFAVLADGALEDFGCSEDCFEECALDRTEYNGLEFVSLNNEEDTLTCSVTTCCSAV